MTTVNTASATPGQFVYAALPIPIVLEANTAYVFLSEETIGGDHFYSEGGASVTTTADAVLFAAALGDAIPPAHINYFGSTNQAFGPLDLKYAVGGIAGRPRTLVGTPYGPHLSTYRFTPSLSAAVMTGTSTVAGSWNIVPSGTLAYKWAVYGPTGNPMFSPIFTVASGSGIDTLSWSFNTTTMPNGTYVFYPVFLDASSVSLNQLFPNVTKEYIGNGGTTIVTPLQVPTVFRNPNFVSSLLPNYITYDGVPHPIHTTYPIPYTPIPGANNPASPYHSDPSQLRNSFNWFAEVQPGARQPEYSGIPEFITSAAGGVAVSYLDPGGNNNTFNAYPTVVKNNPFGGTRLNSFVTPFSNFVEHPTIAGEWWGCAINGQVFKIDRHGNTTTIVGPERDLSKLTNPVAATEDDVTRVIIGTHPVGLGDMGGANDLCFDPRDHNILYVAAQLDQWIAKVNISAKSVEIYAGSPFDPTPEGYVDGPALSAKFNNPTSIIMAADGTMYVADSVNWAIRKITSSGTIGIAGTVSTLCGGTLAPTPPNESSEWLASNFYAVSSIAWNSGTQIGTVVMATPVANLQVGWTLTLSGVVLSGGSGNPNVNYIVSTLTDTSHFTVVQEFAPNRNQSPITGTYSGSMTMASHNADYYSRPGNVTFTGGAGWIAHPQAIRFASNGNIVVLENGGNCVREIILSGPSANSIRRIGCPDNSLQADLGGWGWLDVDTAGTCGPVDDIVVAKWETFLSAAHWINRMSFAQGSIPGQSAYGMIFASDNAGGILGSYGPLNQILYGPGHYPWAFSFSRLEGRWIATGFSSIHAVMARIRQPSDPSDLDQPRRDVLDRGLEMMRQGTVLGFPLGARPAFVSLWGEYGSPHIGNRVGAPNSFEEMQAMFPTDGALAAYIQGGMGGPVALPEFTGNALRDMIYFIRTQTPQGFGTAPGLDDPNYVPPLFLSLSVSRVDPTTIRAVYTTSAPTIGVIGAGSTTQAITYGHYPLFSSVENGFSTSHDHTVTVPAGMTPVHCVIVTRDNAGNLVKTNDLTVI